MRDIADIIMRRSAPGIFIFDQNAEVLLSNSVASQLVVARPSLDEEIRALCDRAKASLSISSGRNVFQFTAFSGEGPPPHCVIRAFMVELASKAQKHIIVLLEKVVKERRVNLEYAKRKFNLSKRELELLVPLCQGLTNKAISEHLFISQHTVKGHIRNIMRKVGVNSRGALVASLQ